jgi:ankyrin repeat protein
MTTDRCETYRRHKAAHEAYVRGDLEALREALSNPPDFPNCRQPFDMAVGDHPLEYAIYWSPAGFVAELIRLGADPNYLDPAGFPPLIAAVSARRSDRNEILKLLLENGADTAQRGINDWTALHFAVAERDIGAVRLLLAHGADPDLKTRIDDYTSALEDAEAAGFAEAVASIREARSKKTWQPNER